jgi:hypothetical protein
MATSRHSRAQGPGHRVRFCALLRADTGLPPVSVDAYLHFAITR